jgi:hypothetical protein
MTNHCSFSRAGNDQEHAAQVGARINHPLGPSFGGESPSISHTPLRQERLLALRVLATVDDERGAGSLESCVVKSGKRCRSATRRK